MTTGRSNSIHLGLLLHNHQPVGNFPWVFEQVYQQSYLPMLKALERHPSIRLSLHYTGSLLDWIEEAHPDFLERIAALVNQQQIEVVSGGYYEPILPSIPGADQQTQITRLTERIRRNFHTSPTGMWLAERVWEPTLPGIMHKAGIEWTIVDDVHFKNVGLEDKDLLGYYMTEDLGYPLKVYATSKDLRYTIPWRPVGETIEKLRSLTTLDGSRILAMGDDGEKFGSWPDTSEYCWGHDGYSGWVEQFFTALEENSAWIRLIPLGEYAQMYPACGSVYIPTSSYIEMTEWVLPAKKSYQFGNLLHRLEDEHRDDLLQFMRGGFWRNFMVKYSEVNTQHKKMLRVHDAVYKAGASDEYGLKQLLKAQANDTYWHGLFGGIYMNHVRSAIYHHLIKAENAADKALMGTAHWQRSEFTDFDRDSHPELLIESDQQSLYIAPDRGGSLFEWDLRRSQHNLCSVMTRREESYHQTLRTFEQERRARHGTHTEEGEAGNPHTTIRTKEANLDQLLVVDWYRRHSLIDHFLPPGVTLQEFARSTFEDLGDFVERPYTPEVQQDDRGIKVILNRQGMVRRAGALSPVSILLTKTLFLPIGEERLEIAYTLQNQSQSRLESRFGVEWNLNLLGGGHNDQAYYSLESHQLDDAHFDSTGEVPAVSTLHIGNRWLQQDMSFTLSEPATLWRFSIDTVTGSEAGFERTHQGSSITFLWPLTLESGQNWHVQISCTGKQI